MKPDQHFAGLIQEAFSFHENPFFESSHEGTCFKANFEVEQVSIDGFPQEGGRLLIKYRDCQEVAYYIDVWKVRP